MNVSRYVQLFDSATWAFFASVGIDRSYIRDKQAGMFAVEEHLRYLNELREGEALEVYSKMLIVRERTVEYVNVMVDPVRRRVAAVAELVGLHIDMRTRRSTPLPPEIAAAFRAMIIPEG
jgi:acyl-CoA thioester hydrolase